jgi:replication factor A1
MSLEKIVNQILSSCTNIKHEEILEKIKTKKEAAGDFLTDETAARIVATELGVEIVKKPPRLKIQIKDLFSGLNNVSLSGKVVSIYPPKTFKRKNWTEGKLASIRISDKSGNIRVVLWDDKVNIVETGQLQQEQTVRIVHAYVREGYDGKPELHVGDRGDIKIERIEL